MNTMPSPALMFEHLSTAVLCFDPKLHLQAINPAGEALLELSAKKLHGIHALTLFPDCKCLLTPPTTPHPVTEHGLRLNVLGHHFIMVDCTITSIWSAEDQQGSAFLVELVNIDQQLRLTREESLLLQHQATQNLLRGMAHEIKNPLGGLRGAAQLLARELPENQREYTEIIIGEADRLQNLLNRMLGSHTPPQKEWINVHKVLCRVRQIVLTEAGDNVTFLADYDPSLPDIFVDPDQLHQVLLNIMRNAIQAMENQGHLILRTRIERNLSLSHPQTKSKQYRLAVRIDIQDDGPGIEETMLEQIFYPMVTGRAEGTGLGLSIVQNLIHRNNGMIQCRSEPGETVFTVFLPIEKATSKQGK
ncbi:nitrogen regulation protein NR(II) [Candidatus Venteria ishoeyi]|uniref:histidine kinase n=1 Tax=Candidatus Venteria ishoeyi TaxID=1899563 RepID=A0A1H6FDZ5_9GAMM|nr:nitrogen regulation protein NR(II) [Candidatus Venteria ishoeyi]MDM8545850.1 nitrogen regulation protein NR(II) [Candidatus Venteria ishoeyi]SEH08310.1 Nitrogen regulation protein NR(II) [Candidatus Venteria ishoeyi]